MSRSYVFSQQGRPGREAPVSYSLRAVALARRSASGSDTRATLETDTDRAVRCNEQPGSTERQGPLRSQVAPLLTFVVRLRNLCARLRSWPSPGGRKSGISCGWVLRCLVKVLALIRTSFRASKTTWFQRVFRRRSADPRPASFMGSPHEFVVRCPSRLQVRRI